MTILRIPSRSRAARAALFLVAPMLPSCADLLGFEDGIPYPPEASVEPGSDGSDGSRSIGADAGQERSTDASRDQGANAPPDVSALPDADAGKIEPDSTIVDERSVEASADVGLSRNDASDARE